MHEGRHSHTLLTASVYDFHVTFKKRFEVMIGVVFANNCVITNWVEDGISCDSVFSSNNENVFPPFKLE